MNLYTRLLYVCASGARLSSSSSSLQVLISNLYFFKRTLLKKISFYSLFICYNWILATTTCTEISNTVSFSTHSRERRRRCTGFDLSVFLQTVKRALSTDQKYLLNVPFFYFGYFSELRRVRKTYKLILTIIETTLRAS